MKRRKDKGKAVSAFFAVLFILIHLLSILPTACADSYIVASFDPCMNEPPHSPINIDPADGSKNVEIPATLRVLVYDNTSLGQILVSFYDATDDSLIGNTSVYNGDIASVIWSGLEGGTNYRWYAVANDSEYENTSSEWKFKTKSYADGGGDYTPIQNQPPVANITGPPTGYTNQTILFSAKNSYDSDGYIVGYRWDFDNDGLFDVDWLDETIVIHTYSAPGSYTVKLQIEDNDGEISTYSYVIDIIPLEPDQYPPVAQIEINLEEGIVINESISFDASGSYDSDGVIVSYLWDFDDENTSILVNPVHSYTQPGNYTVTLTATDDDGLTSAAAVTISVKDNETVEPEPEERELPVIILSIIAAAMAVAAISIIFIIKKYGLVLVIEEIEETKEDKTESIKSKLENLLSKIR